MTMQAGKRPILPGILGAVGVCLGELPVMLLFYEKSLAGELISVSQASAHLGAAVCQSLLTFLYPAALLIAFSLALKKNFAGEMNLRLSGRWQRITALVLGLALLGLTGYGLLSGKDPVTVWFALIYYLVTVAFEEEFIVRGAAVWFLRNAPAPVRYLVPNVCFALLHVFSYAGWEKLSAAYLLHFLTSDLLGLTLMGCFFQWLKEKSDSIWIPVLLHALLDYTALLKL